MANRQNGTQRIHKAKGYKPRWTAEGADIAVQIKHYEKGNNVVVQLIRELDSTKKNHGCVLEEMITTSRFTQQARVEADRRRIECRGQEWVERKLLAWRDEQIGLRGLVRMQSGQIIERIFIVPSN